MTALTDLLASWREKANAATSGPWLLGDEDVDGVPIYLPSGMPLCASPDDGVAGSHSSENAEFIAESRTAVPRLLDAVEAVLALHKPVDVDFNRPPANEGSTCNECGSLTVAWPCDTVRAIIEALGASE